MQRETRSTFSKPDRWGRSSDEQVLSLRDQGKSYAAVATSLGLKRSRDAHASFLRALRKRDGQERSRLIQRESARLDDLEIRIRIRDVSSPEKMQRRLGALGKLREEIAAISPRDE